MRIGNSRVQLLLDEIHGEYLTIPHFAHFEKGDYSKASRFPDRTPAALARYSRLRLELVAKIEAVKAGEGALSPYDLLALELAAYFVDYMMFPVSPLLEPHYHLVFGITPYELLVEPFWDKLGLFPCGTPGEVARHGALVADFARYARDMLDRLRWQADRGVYLFADVIPSTCEVISGYGSVAYEDHPFCMRRPGSAATEAQIAAEQGRIDEANGYFRDIVALLRSGPYLERAPKRPGWGQFEGGAAYYRHLRKLNLGYDIPARELHELGLGLLRQAEQGQAAIRLRLAGGCDHEEFLSRLRGDKRFHPRTPEELAGLMASIREREAALVPLCFGERVRTPYRIERLDPEVEKSLTFGYFQPSSDETQPGVYYYNASGLEEKSQLATPALLAHELVPGHHFHQSYIRECEDMHPVIKAIVAPACLEGWAEYAASLMTEAGIFDDYDEYGRLENEKFASARLVVDTGLNELGWSLEDGRRFLEENTFATRAMAESETLRYAYSIPAQCLPYRHGAVKLHEIREGYRKARGERYAIRDFHSLVLNAGCIPLPLLQSYVERQAGNGA